MKPGTKLDAGKRDWTLLPWRALAEVVEVLEYGERKYARENWKLVPDAEQRYRAALLRHTVALAEDPGARDPESGLSHAAHAACNALFLLWFEQGDRPEPTQSARSIQGESDTLTESLGEALDVALEERDSARAMIGQLEAKLREGQADVQSANAWIRDRGAIHDLLAKTEAERDRLAFDALDYLSKYTSTPEKGYLVEPHVLSADIQRLGKERDAAVASINNLGPAYGEACVERDALKKDLERERNEHDDTEEVSKARFKAMGELARERDDARAEVAAFRLTIQKMAQHAEALHKENADLRVLVSRTGGQP